MSSYGSLTITCCPTCHKKQALLCTMRAGTLIVCNTCHSHLQVDTHVPPRLMVVAVQRTANSQPESYA